MLDLSTNQRHKEKLHDWNIIPRDARVGCDEIVPSKIGRRNVKQKNTITWTVSDIAKAGCLLQNPPIATNFEDEHEMRRVYTLIYDVFRYKNVLMQALNDISFFQIFEKLQNCTPIIWLLFYDLYHRSFKKRETAVKEITSKLFYNAKLSFAENALWLQKVKLAAAVARIRIKYNALTLRELLPSHLRGDKVNKESNHVPVTVWINNKKFKNVIDIKKQIELALKVKLVDELKDLGPENFKWDTHCPSTIAFHYSMRTQLAKSHLVRTHKLIVQDRSFCVGPATFWKVVEDLQLSGSVIQTHVNSPRTTAYLANLLAQSERIKKLMAFSAGRRKLEYETYLNDLGMTNVVIYSDKLLDIGFESPCMEEVVAVYATPPNSYSAVSDPIDLVCSRGGDLSMLEVLTESEDTLEGRNRVTTILEEQKRTLKLAMSRPQIQVVLYETHSELDVENSNMVTNTLKETNKLAKIHHATLQGLLNTNNSIQTQMSSGKTEINNNQRQAGEESEQVQDPKQEEGEINDSNSISAISTDHLKVVVPDTDLFDTSDLPCLCPGETNCQMRSGCYLALIQRKQVLSLDNKYMIQMAEQKGLFGSTTNTSMAKQKSNKTPRQKQQNTQQEEIKPKKSKKKMKSVEIQTFYVELQETSGNLSILEDKHCREISSVRKYFESDSGVTKENNNGNIPEHTDQDILITGLLGKLTDDQLKSLISPSSRFNDEQSIERIKWDNNGTKPCSSAITPKRKKREPDYNNISRKIQSAPSFKSRKIEVVTRRSSTSKRKFSKVLRNEYHLQLLKSKQTKSITIPDCAATWMDRKALGKNYLTIGIKAFSRQNEELRTRITVTSKIEKKFTTSMMHRLTTPTRASSIKSIRKENSPSSRKTNGVKATEDFLCECSKRKHHRLYINKK